MKKNQFNYLTDLEKTELLSLDGVYIGKLALHGITSMLFQLHSFYVEIHYKSYRGDIWRIETFSSPEIIDKYFPESGKEKITTSN